MKIEQRDKGWREIGETVQTERTGEVHTIIFPLYVCPSKWKNL